MGSVALAFLDGRGFALFGAFDLAAGREALVAQHAQHFDLGALAAARAVFDHFDRFRAGFAVFVGAALFIGLGAPQHQELADVLHGGGVQLGRQLLVGEFARGAVVAQYADFDEAVGVEGGVHLFAHSVGQAVGANVDNGVEVVRLGAVGPALGRGQFNLGHGAYYPPPATMQAMKTKTQSKKVNKAWLHDHVNDPYVKLSQKEGYRSRAAYKLQEIDEQFGLIRPGARVVDLGCAPGAWCQYVRRRLSPGGAAAGQIDGAIVGLDLLPMEPVEGVTYLQGDFREPEVLQRLEAALLGQALDVVVSDMAPNLSGIGASDTARIAHLVELAVDFACAHLQPGGALVAKVFHGSGYDGLVRLFREHFKVVKPVKPKASRDKSAETYLVGIGLKNR